MDQKPTDQTSPILVVFGATGDLAQKKIFPALEALYTEGALGADPHIVGVSRREWNDREFEAFLRERESVSSPEFVERISYSRVDIAAGTGYDGLASLIERLQGSQKRQVVYYTSLAPELHGEAIKGLQGAHLLYSAKKAAKTAPDASAAPAPKLLIEKPFGTDEKSARALDKLIASVLDEDQVYRVDHYLGKDTVRALMDLHENTPELAHLVSAEGVQSIRIRLFEEKGIDGRGASYDHVGAFRDVGQNHMLELLSIVAADTSKKDWQAARADVLERLAPPARTCELSRRGQYEGYQSERGVKPGSETETAFEVITNLRSGKLKGIPLTLEAGKKMSRSEVFAEVVFKEMSGLPRRMVFRVQPDQEIIVENRDGSTEAFAVPRTRDAYGNIILDALRGIERTFVGRKEIEALWAYADHVVACWGKVPLEIYGAPGRPGVPGADGQAKPFLLE